MNFWESFHDGWDRQDIFAENEDLPFLGMERVPSELIDR